MTDNQKHRYIVYVEGVAPVKLELEVMAVDEKEAIELVSNPRVCKIRQKPDVDLSRLRKTNIKIKDAITSLVKLVKSF